MMLQGTRRQTRCPKATAWRRTAPARYRGWVTHDLDLMTSDSDPARIRKWFDAVRMGFHQTKGTDSQFEHFLADARVDGTIFRSVADADNPDGMPVGTLASFDQTLNAGQEVLPARLITDVTVRPTHRRQGMLRQMITTDLADAHDRGLPVAALTVTEATIYGRFGFGVSTIGHRIEVDSSVKFRLHAGAGDDHGRVRVVEPEDAIDSINEVYGVFHASTRGSVDWPNFYQDWLSGRFDFDADGPSKKLRCALHLDRHGKVDGFVNYTIGDRGDGPRAVEVQMLIATTPQSHIGLWEYLAAIDLTDVVRAGSARIHDPLMWAMVDRRGYRITGAGDLVWCRILDPVRCLQARPWLRDGTMIIGIDDPLGFASGRFRIEVSAGTATVTPTDEPAAVTLPAEVLAGLWLGSSPVSQVAAAGRIHGTPDAFQQLAMLMDLHDAPYGVTFF